MENKKLDLAWKKNTANFGEVLSEKTEEYLSLDNLELWLRGHESVKQIQREYDNIQVNYQKLHAVYEGPSWRVFNNNVKLREQNENLQYQINNLRPRILLLEQQLLIEEVSSLNDQNILKGQIYKLENDDKRLLDNQFSNDHKKICEDLHTTVNKNATIVWDNKSQLNEKLATSLFMGYSGISLKMKQLSEFLQQIELDETKRAITKMYDQISLELFEKVDHCFCKYNQFMEKERANMQIIRQKLKEQMEKYRDPGEKIPLTNELMSKFQKNLKKERGDTTTKYSIQSLLKTYEQEDMPWHLSNNLLKNKRKELNNTTSPSEKVEITLTKNWADQQLQIENGLLAAVKKENTVFPNTSYSLLFEKEAPMNIKNYQNDFDKNGTISSLTKQEDIEACLEDKQICSHHVHDIYETKPRIIAELLNVLNEKWKVFRELILVLESSIVCLVLYQEWLAKNFYKGKLYSDKTEERTETTINSFFSHTRSSSDKINIGCIQLKVDNMVFSKRMMTSRIKQKRSRLRSHDENRRNIYK